VTKKGFGKAALRSSSSCLNLLPRLPVTYILLSIHMHNLANNILGRMGAQNRPWVLETLRSHEVREREDWFEPVVNIATPLSPHFHTSFFYLHLFNSIGKKKNTIWVGGICPPKFAYAFISPSVTCFRRQFLRRSDQ
jgi:hypothetical protein